MMRHFRSFAVAAATILIATSVLAQPANRYRTDRGRVDRERPADTRGGTGGTASDFAIKSFRNGSQQPQGVINSPLVVPYGPGFR